MASKMTCPACDSYTSGVLLASQEGEPCPGCGLPAEAAAQVLEAQKRSVEEGLTRKYMEAEQRAAKAETEAALLRAKLAAIERVMQRDAEDFGSPF